MAAYSISAELAKLQERLNAADDQLFESLKGLEPMLNRPASSPALAGCPAPRPNRSHEQSRWSEGSSEGTSDAHSDDKHDLWRAAAQSCSNVSINKLHAVSCLLGKWSMLNLNGRSIQEILEDVDTNNDGFIDKAELYLILKRSGIQAEEEDVHRVWEELAQDDGKGNHRIGVHALEDAVELAMVRKHITDWLQDLPIYELIAHRLIDDSFVRHKTRHDNPIHRLVDLNPAQLLQRLKGIQNDIEACVCHGLADFAADRPAPTSSMKSGEKFIWSTSGKGREALFGDTAFFRKGLNDLIGLPDEDIAEAMEAEHISAETSYETFETSNYSTSTCPAKEWEFVVCPDPLKTYPGESGPNGRKRVPLEHLMRNRPSNGHCDDGCMGCSSCLTREEVIALRLYTGPMYMFYNDVLRGLLRQHAANTSKAADGEMATRSQKCVTKESSLKLPLARESSHKKLKRVGRELSWGARGDETEDLNRQMMLGVEYRTTIHMISSGIVKLSEIMKRPPTRKLYRGLSGMKLPDRLFKEDALGWKGAVEVAFMSCTLKRSVALQYIGEAAMPILFDIEVSQIDRGASLGWLSQYPNEEEVLLPPLSNLEVNGEPKMMVTNGKTIIVFQMQLNVNLKIMKREEHEGRRKALHLASVFNTYMELNRDLRDACRAIKQQPFVSKIKGFRQAQAISGMINDEVNELVSMQDARDVSWYNNDRNYKTALEEVALMKEMAMAKFKWWQENIAVKVENFNQLSMLQVMKFQASKHYHEYCALRERYSVKKFELDARKKISRSIFENVLMMDIGERVKGHQWSAELIDQVWKELKKNSSGDDDELSVREFAGLQGLVMYDARAGGLCFASGSEDEITLQQELKQAALKVIEAYVDEQNLDQHYGVDEDTALITAASQGDDAEVELYLDAGAHLEVCNNKGYNAIASAVCQGMDDCLEILFTAAHERGLDLNAILEQKNDAGKTPLALACSNGWADCVRVLLREGAEISTISNDGFTPFISAAEHGHLDIVTLLLEADPTIIFERNEKLKGWSAMHLAARNGHTHVVQYLWKIGGEKLLRMNRFDGRTVLMSAVLNGDEGFTHANHVWPRREIASFCVEQCPDMLVSLDNIGRSCLHIAAEEDQVNMLSWLLEQVLYRHGKEAAAQMLLKEDSSHMNCVHLACIKKGSKVFMYLTDPSNLTWLGNSSAPFLDDAEAAGLCQQLVTSTAFNDRTCLHLAAGLGKKKIILRLLEMWKAEKVMHLIHACQKDGRTAAHSAANFGHLGVLDMLYRYEVGSQQLADYNQSLLFKPDFHGWTPLHWVADSVQAAAKIVEEEDEKKHAQMLQARKQEAGVAIVRFICRKYSEHRGSTHTGAHILFHAENRGRTALHLAVCFGTADLTSAILEEAETIGGAERLAKQARSGGLLAMHSAAKAGRPEMVRLIYNFCGSKVGASMVEQRDDDGWTPLFWALAFSKECHSVDFVDAKRLETIQLLIEYVLSIGIGGLNAVDNYGISLLQLACASNSVELVKLFVEELVHKAPAAAVEEPCRLGRGGLSWKTTHVAPKHVSWATKGMSGLLFAARAGALRVFRLLVEDYRVCPDASDDDGRRAVHHACLYRRLNILDYLVRQAEESGDQQLSFLFEADIDGATCLHLACGQQENPAVDSEMVMDDLDSEGEDDADEALEKELLSREEDDEEDDVGANAGWLSQRVLSAASSYEPKFLKYAGMAVEGALKRKDLKSGQGKCRVHESAPLLDERVMQCTYVHVVKRLCELGGHRLLTQQDRQGRTALHACVWSANFNRCKLLLEWGGAELLHIQDHQGQTCLHIAAAEAAKGERERAAEVFAFLKAVPQADCRLHALRD